MDVTNGLRQKAVRFLREAYKFSMYNSCSSYEKVLRSLLVKENMPLDAPKNVFLDYLAYMHNAIQRRLEKGLPASRLEVELLKEILELETSLLDSPTSDDPVWQFRMAKLQEIISTRSGETSQ